MYFLVAGEFDSPGFGSNQTSFTNISSGADNLLNIKSKIFKILNSFISPPSTITNGKLVNCYLYMKFCMDIRLYNLLINPKFINICR